MRGAWCGSVLVPPSVFDRSVSWSSPRLFHRLVAPPKTPRLPQLPQGPRQVSASTTPQPTAHSSQVRLVCPRYPRVPGMPASRYPSSFLFIPATGPRRGRRTLMISASPDLIAWGWGQLKRETCLFLRQTATSLSGPGRLCTNTSLRTYNRAPGPNPNPMLPAASQAVVGTP